MSEKEINSPYRVIFGGVVQEGDDDLNIGRVRVFPDHEVIKEKLRSIDAKYLNSSQTDIAENYRFTDFDPFVFIPLLPFNLNYVPSEKEYVHIFYTNSQENPGRKNQFYIPGPNSSPMNLSFESEKETRKIMGFGANIRQNLAIKDKTGKFRNKKSEGVFANKEDIGIYSKGRSDIILKDTEVLIRAAKTNNLQENKFPEKNQNRSFLQLSYFENERFEDPSKILTKIVEQNNNLKKLIEYDIIAGLDNDFDVYSGNVKIYNVPNIALTETSTFSEKTELPSQFMTPVFTSTFTGISGQTNVVNIINSIIKGLNDGKVVDNLTGSTVSFSEDVRFPFFYRPAKALLSQSDALKNDINIANRVNQILLQISYSPSSLKKGSGLLSGFNDSGPKYKTQTEVIKQYRYETSPVGFSVMGSDNIFLLSHKTSIPGKVKVDLGENTVYGIDRSLLYDSYKTNTEGLVRGEALKQLINVIVNFLISHQHPYHGTPPIPQGVEEIQSELQQFDTKIINQNIRIN
jgi:hypothetical protein